MTYQDVLKQLLAMPAERLNDTATVFCQLSNEYVPIDGVWSAGEENDVLDEDHPYFVVAA